MADEETAKRKTEWEEKQVYDDEVSAAAEAKTAPVTAVATNMPNAPIATPAMAHNPNTPTVVAVQAPPGAQVQNGAFVAIAR